MDSEFVIKRRNTPKLEKSFDDLSPETHGKCRECRTLTRRQNHGLKLSRFSNKWAPNGQGDSETTSPSGVLEYQDHVMRHIISTTFTVPLEG